MAQIEIEGIRQVLHVIEMPDQTEKIEVRKTARGWWQVFFIVGKIEMTLAKKSNIQKPLLFQSLSTAESRLKAYGWVRGFYVIQ